MAPPPDPFAELVAWKLAGVAAWHTGVTLGAAALWHATPGAPRGALSPGGAGAALVLWASSLLLLLAQRRLASFSDVPPALAPRLGLRGRGWAAAVASRCVLRGRRAADLIALAALYGAAALSGAASVAALTVAPGAFAGRGDGGWGLQARGAQGGRALHAPHAACIMHAARCPPASTHARMCTRPGMRRMSCGHKRAPTLPPHAAPRRRPLIPPARPRRHVAPAPAGSGAPGRGWQRGYGAALGLLYAVTYLLRCGRHHVVAPGGGPGGDRQPRGMGAWVGA